MARRHTQALVRAWLRGSISRRQLIRRLALAGMSMPAIVALLAACGGSAEPASTPAGGDQGSSGGEGTATSEEGTAGEGSTLNVTMPDYIDRSKLSAELHLYNWSEYLAPEVPKAFEAAYGVRVIEDTFASNEDLLAKLQGGASGYDVIVPSDYMVGVMIQLGMLEPLDKDVIQSFANIDPGNLGAYYDPNNDYSMPYLWGTTGVLYDVNVLGEGLDSWEAVFHPAPEAQGKLAMLDDQREVIGAALMFLGYSVNETSDEALAKAKELLLEQKPYVTAYSSQNNDDMMLGGEAVMAHMWTGDALLTADQKEGLTYFLPKEGAVIWQDNLAVPKGAPNLYTAMAFIDFMNLPEVAAANANFVWYGSPNKAARDQGLIEDWILENPSVYPSAEVMERLQWIEDVGDDISKYDRIWTEFKTA